MDDAQITQEIMLNLQNQYPPYLKNLYQLIDFLYSGSLDEVLEDFQQ